MKQQSTMELPQNLQFRYVHKNLTCFQIANISPGGFQVLYPVALAAAIFSMQPAVIPFDLSPRSFTIAIFVLIALVFVIRRTLLHWTWWRKKFAAQMKTRELDEIVEHRSTSGYLSGLAPITGRYLNGTRGDVEMDAFGARGLHGVQSTVF